MSMTMEYELITPEIAASILENNNPNNRKISRGTVQAYASDMLAGNWDEETGASISIDESGVLRDGQQRLTAIVESGVSLHMWVCRNVSADGIYDNNRKRSNSDQISIMRSDFENVYKSTRYISIARAIITACGKGSSRRTVTPKEVIDFTDTHKEILDGFFLNVPQTSVPKISLGVVHLGMFCAYCGGVSIEDVMNFYDVLCTGMSVNQEEFPIIAYRNYLKDIMRSPSTTMPENARCQYALKKYLTKSCVKRSISPKDLIWPLPFKNNKEEN